MSASFDPYAEWLSIADPQRPPNHYQLIGIEPFADDPQAISTAADAALLRVRAVRPGANADEWQQVLDELSIAKLTLTNPLRKLQYDAQLRARLAAEDAQPATVPQSVPTAVDPNLFPPGAVPTVSTVPTSVPVRPAVAVAAPAIVRPSAVAVAAPPIAASPAAVPFVQSHAMPPVQTSPQQSTAPAVAPITQTVTPQYPQSTLAMPILTPQEPGVSQDTPARVVESVSMPPLFERVRSAAPAAPPGKPDFEMPLFTPAPASQPANSEQPAAAAESQPVLLSQETNFVVPAYLSKQTHKSSTGAFIGGTAAVVVVVVVGILLTSGRKRPPVDAPTTLAQATATPAAHAKDDQASPQAPTHTTNDDIRPVESPSDLPSDKGPLEKISSDEPAARGETNQAKPVIADEPDPQSAPGDPDSEMPAETAPETPVDPPKQPAPEATPPSEINPPATENKPAVDPEKAAAFARSVKVARAALGARNLAKAKQEVEAAVAAASTPQQQEQAERLRLLAGYVDEFWTNVGKALKDLQPTDEIKIGSTTAAIVESDETSITIHVAGKNLAYKLSEMPVGLVIALADRWFDAKNPTTKVFYGAFYAADAKGDPKEARRLWEEATLSGASTTELLPVLDEGAAVLAAEQGPVPDAKQLSAAETTFKAAYQQELRTAKSPQRKLELAKKFVDVALTTEDPAERYVLFNEGYKIASEGGNPPGIVRSVDEMAKWYKVDSLELKTKALAKAGTSTSNSLVAKAVARSALELLDQALADKRFDQAGKLGQAALTAAKKSKDAALVKQATEREQQVREMTKDNPADDSTE